jgi:hypothetical protein
VTPQLPAQLRLPFAAYAERGNMPASGLRPLQVANDGFEALGRCLVSAYAEAFQEGQEFVVESVPGRFDFKRRRAREASLINARLQGDRDTCRHRKHTTGSTVLGDSVYCPLSTWYRVIV